MEKEAILNILSKLDQELASKREKMTLIIVGYSTVSLTGLDERGTEDIDALKTRNSRLLYKHISLPSARHLLPDRSQPDCLCLWMNPEANRRDRSGCSRRQARNDPAGCALPRSNHPDIRVIHRSDN